MVRYALLPAALVLSLGAASAAPNAFRSPDVTAAAQDVTRERAATLSVRAGVGGFARPGRWLPVDVALASASPLRGQVIVEWGGAIARQDVDLAPGVTSRISLLVRTIMATPDVRVSLIDDAGATAAASTTTVALLPLEDPAVLCVDESPVGAACGVRIPGGEAPRNWRGFDLADDVVWSGDRSATPAAANAFELWQAARWWQNSGAVDPVVAPFDTESKLASRTSLTLAVFVAALLCSLGIVTRLRPPVAVMLATPIVVAAGALALVSRSSRDVDMQQAAFVHQFSGIPQSIAIAKGSVEHPSGGTVAIAPNIEDASVEIVRGLQSSDSVTSRDGRAIYRNTAGRGVRQRFELTGTIDHEWLSVDQRDGVMTLRNLSPATLGDCELRATDITPIGTLAASASMDIAKAGPLRSGDSIVCTLPAEWLTWSASNATVAVRGSAFLIFHFWPGPDRASSVADAAR